tara:strand:- start:2401 stop:3606 length:1206 start_codon:yes stop_codon:yes gene_type:complete
MKTKLLILLLSFIGIVNGQNFPDTIAYDQMEGFTWAGNWWSGSPTTGFFTNASKSSPASAVIYGTGGGADEFDWYSLPNIDTLEIDQEYKVQINLGSYRFTSTGPNSGVDVNDYIDVQVSTDGGLTYNSEIRITGNNNAYWDFNSKAVSKVIDGNLDIYTPAGGGDRTLAGDGYSIIELIFPLGTRQIAIDVLAVVDRAGEEWWFDDFFLLGSGSGTSLPIDLISFNAEADGTSVDVTWVVSSQVNNDYYIIEKSMDCYTWKEVNRMSGEGNSNTETVYGLTDKHAYIGLSYYRLRQVDYDGKSETFHPVSVQVVNDKTIGLSIRPNPAISSIELEMDYTLDPLINHNVQIFDMNGNRVYKKHFIGEIHNFQINIEKLNKGAYILKSKSDNINAIGKFIKE